MGDNSLEPKPTVLITGFGPFGNHDVNASWCAVQELEKIGIGDNVNLEILEIPVEYDTVKTLVPSLWKKYSPKLVVHVGVSGIAKAFTLEQQAHNDGYDKLDVKGTFPHTRCCVDGGPTCLMSQLDMNKVRDEVNQSDCGVEAVVSMDPGRYLCDFIYFTSLSINTSCSAFIHVPPLDKPYTARQLAKGIRTAVQSMLSQCNTHHHCSQASR